MAPTWIWSLSDWPQFQWDMGVLAEALGAARRAQGRLELIGELLDPTLMQEALTETAKVEAISTSAIEGEKPNLALVTASVAQHLGLPRDSDASANGYEEGLVAMLFDSIESHAESLTVEMLCGWQKGLFPTGCSGLYQVTVGELRPGEVMVASGPHGREVVHFQAVPREHLELELTAFMNWFNSTRGRMDGLIRAGIVHLWFVTLHPFDDGNGRISRALTDMALAQDGGRVNGLFRMSSRILRVRSEYYAMLEQTQHSHAEMDVTPWMQWFLAQVAEACSESEHIIQRTVAKAKFWATHRDHDLNERQRKVLNRVLDAGPGGFEGEMNARKYASITHSSKPTASRDLAELVAKGCLVHVGGGGRSTSYDIPWGKPVGLKDETISVSEPFIQGIESPTSVDTSLKRILMAIDPNWSGQQLKDHEPVDLVPSDGMSAVDLLLRKRQKGRTG